MLVGGGTPVHLIAAGESWPVNEVNSRRRCQEQLQPKCAHSKYSFPAPPDLAFRRLPPWSVDFRLTVS